MDDEVPNEAQAKPAQSGSWLNLLIDFGPLLVFFLSYQYFSPEDADQGFGVVLAVTKATASFMAATLVALIVSKWKLGKVSPMIWLSSVLIIGFGGLTILLNDPFYIQFKSTAVYTLFALVLFAGLLRGKAMLRFLLQSAFDGLDDEGWLKLSRNWAFFFLFLAALNEVVRRLYNVENGGFGTWLNIKTWVFPILSFVFTFAQLPMVLRHGLDVGQEEEVIKETPLE